MNTRYNYVIMNAVGDYNEPLYSPLKMYPFIRVYDYAFDTNAILQKIFFLHWSKKVNDVFNLPLKKIWFNRMCSNDFEDDKPICYVFLAGKYITEEPKLVRYIKTQNPNNKCVVYYADLISKTHVDIQRLKQLCDFLVSYDRGEADKYKINYYDETAYSSIVEQPKLSEFKYDVYFLGYAKNRLQQIHDIYFALERAGLRCNFIVCGVQKRQQLRASGLHYNMYIPYRQNLNNVLHSKCVLEIIQGGSTANTLRVFEAQVYHRKLLTNNINIKNQPYYNLNNIQVFQSIHDIQTEFFDKDIDRKGFIDNYFDSINRIKYFEQLLVKGE